MKKKAVFLDRDGNINEDIGYPCSYDQIKIYSHSFEAVKKINEQGLLAVIVTNQSGVGRGLIKEENLYKIHNKLKTDFLKHRAFFDGIYYCPHYIHSEIPLYKKDCQCRKPNPGMAIRASLDLNIDLEQSYMIGDKVEDIQFGFNIKAIPVLVLTGFGTKSLPILKKEGIEPGYIASNLLDAIKWILRREK